MKLLNVTLLALGILAVTTGCDKTKPAQAKKEIKISASVDQTRALESVFENDDKVGLFVANYNQGVPTSLLSSGNYADNIRFRYNSSNNTWTPQTPIYWPDETTHADLYLYYPYAENLNSVSNFTFTVNADQSTHTNFTNSDFMWGKASNVAPTKEVTTVSLKHLMSRIKITLKPGLGFTQASLAEATIGVKVNNIICGSNINITNGTLSAIGEKTSITPNYENGNYLAVLPPQTVAEGNLISVTVNGRVFNLKSAFTFVGGKSHLFTVTLNKTSNGVNVTINPWEEDGTDNGGVAE